MFTAIHAGIQNTCSWDETKKPSKNFLMSCPSPPRSGAFMMKWPGHIPVGKVYDHPVHHSISLMCDDLEQTVAELKGKGANFNGDVQDHGYGLVIMMRLPGAGEIQLYQPMHPTAFGL